jgi:hypothetical protein
MTLTKEQIDSAENFISRYYTETNLEDISRIAVNIRSQISCNDMENGKLLYERIINEPISFYESFGSNAYGYSSYGLYKSKNDKIYLIVAWMQDINFCYLVENSSWFD